MKKYDTYFLDIDGTIFKYRTFESYQESPAQLTPGAKEKLLEIKDAGHTIILTTARPESLRDLTITELAGHEILWDQLIMGIGRGPRHLVNDISPKNLKPRAIAWNIDRDTGLKNISVAR